MIKSRIESKCVFCRYWQGKKATRSRQPKFWEYSGDTANCIKRRGVKLYPAHHCIDFELDEYTYFD